MYAKINAWKLGLAGGILWGILLFIMTWMAKYTGYGMFWLSQWIDIYPGYVLTAQGAFIGLIYGFVAGFISMYLLGLVYNLFKP